MACSVCLWCATWGCLLLLLLIFPEDHEGIGQSKLGVLHLQRKSGVPLLLLLVNGALNGKDAGLSVFIISVKLEHFGVRNQSLFRLAALLIKDAQIEPDLTHLRVEGSGLDDVFESISIVACVIVEDGKSCPVDSLAWVLVSGLLEVLKGILIVLKSHVATAKNVDRVTLGFVFLFSFSDEFDSLVDVALKEIGPCKMLIDLVVVFIMRKGCFIGSLGLLIVTCFLIEKTNF